jgi:GNAT superfamily N-acetyltransferase
MQTSPLEISPVQSSAARREFIALARRIYRDHPQWVPPMDIDIAKQIDPARGPFFKHSTAAFFIARRDGCAVGRIAAMRNERHLAAHPDGAGFFGFFECEDDPAAARALLARAEDWLRDAGLAVARGPANFSIQDEAGALMEGFELSPMTGMGYTPPYYAGLLEQAGYTQAKDLWVYRLRRADWKTEQSERILRLAERAAPDVTVRQLNMADLPAEARRMAEVFASAWRDNWGAQPITQEEFLAYSQEFKPFIDPRLILLAERGGECIGMMVAIPNMNEAVAAGRGRLFPFGWLHLLLGRRRARSARVFLLGVKPDARRIGLPVRFFGALHPIILHSRLNEMEFSWILPENAELIALIERFGGRRVQVLRLFEKRLG